MYKEELRTLVKSVTDNKKDVFVVDIEMKPGNQVDIYVDTMEGITVNECAEISRELSVLLEEKMDNFQLNVSSPGLGMPFRLKKQYQKNVGREVEVLLNSGQRKNGILVEVSDEYIVIETEKKEKNSDDIQEQHTITIDNIKKTNLVVSF
jgi:ribosome maturation factor RimP